MSGKQIATGDYSKPVARPREHRCALTVQGILHKRGFRFQDPTAPHFVEDRRPIRCERCGHVPRQPSLITPEGLCRGRLACDARYRDGGRPA